MLLNKNYRHFATAAASPMLKKRKKKKKIFYQILQFISFYRLICQWEQKHAKSEGLCVFFSHTL
jgi:hypothetical protein